MKILADHKLPPYPGYHPTHNALQQKLILLAGADALQDSNRLLLIALHIQANPSDPHNPPHLTVTHCLDAIRHNVIAFAEAITTENPVDAYRRLTDGLDSGLKPDDRDLPDHPPSHPSTPEGGRPV